jgi:ATP-binding cassette, subfamily B, bacterial CvaB/MchF/RaxB
MNILSSLAFGASNRLPLILQTEAAECGLASLAMVASHHGFQTDLASLRRRFTISLKGATLAHLMSAASSLGLAGRPLRLDMEHVGDLKLPCILHWNMNHFVVLNKVSHKRLEIYDPAFGIRSLSHAEFSKHFTGIALELTPTAEFQPATEKVSIRITSLLGRVSGLRRSLGQIFVLALALEVFALISPFFMQWVVDGAIVSADRHLLTVLGIGFALLMLLQAAISVMRSWILLYMSTHLSLQWVANIFSHMLRLPVAYFEKRHLGDVVSRFQSANTIQRTLTTSFVEGMLDGLMSIATLAMMLVYSPKLAAITVVAVLAYALLRFASYIPLKHATEEEIVHSAKQQSHFLETVRGVQSLKLFGRQEERKSRWLNLVLDTTNCSIRTQKLAIGFMTVNRLLFGAERVGVVWLGALLVMDNALSIGMLFAFVAYKDQFAQRISGLIDKLVELKMLRLQAERLADIVLTPPEKEIASMMAANDTPVSLEINDVSFRYADAEPLVLQNCSLKIEPGECVAIVGGSGCGKTTLFKVMLGLLSPNEGTIKVGGKDIQKIGLAQYRNLVATVMQDDQLFAGSIAENISFFDPHSDQEHLESCAKSAAIYDEIIAMPMGFNTLIGDMGAAISGGQKQRILLARALYKRPQILMLDEATSHLDVHRESEVNAAIKKLNLTRILIAHRPETIKMAERVVVLHAGKVVKEMRQIDGVSTMNNAVTNQDRLTPAAA